MIATRYLALAALLAAACRDSAPVERETVAAAVAAPVAAPVTKFPIDPADRGGGVESIAFDGAQLWVTRPFRDSLTPISAADRLGAKISLPGMPNGLLFDGTNLWVTLMQGNAVAKVQRAPLKVLSTTAVGKEPGGLALDGAFLWVSNRSDHTVTKIERATGRAVATYPTGTRPMGMVVAFGSLWVVNNQDDTVSRISPTTGELLGTATVGDGPVGIAATTTEVWVTNFFTGTVSKLSPEGLVLGTYSVGDGAAGILVDGTNLWIACNGASRLVRFDAVKAVVAASFATDANPYGVTAGPGNHIYTVATTADAVNRVLKTAVGVAQ
jgi:DNA-binding beta-propeller fold protein YncE